MSALERVLGAPQLRGWRPGRELGRGATGSVHLVTRPATGERRALKVIPAPTSADGDAGRRFHREVESITALDHPCVVRAHTAGHHDGFAFLMFEYCECGSLADVVTREGPLPVAEAVAMARDVLEGLAYAHAAPVTVTTGARGRLRASGIVHRDLKPHNILATGGGPRRRYKIADFGLAKAFELAGLSALTHTGTMAGTPAFLPRQQAVNFKYAQPEVDVWAAAACLYFALTGYPPRDLVPGRDPWLQVWTTDPKPVAGRGTALPAALSRLVDEAVTDKPNIRFSGVAEFATALAAASEEAGVEWP